MAIIYEVNISVDPKQQQAFKDWLYIHIRDMLEMDGFLAAKLYKLVDETDRPQFCVQYEVETQQQLEAYFSGPAQAMRAQGQRKFKDAIQIKRRMLEEISLE